MKFFRFNAGLAAVLLLVALAFRPETAAATPAATVGLWALGVSAGALLVYWATIGRALARIRPLLLWTTAAAGAVALVAQGLAAAAVESGPSAALTIASFVSSAALLGGACTAMILGHWYLVLPSMDVSLLQSIVRFHIGSTVLRIAVVGGVLWAALATWESPSGAGYASYVWSLDGVFLWQRVLFGLLGAGRAGLPHLGDGEDPLDPVGHRHPLRGLLHRHRRRGAGQVPPGLDAGAAVNLTLVCPDCAGRLPGGSRRRPACRALRELRPHIPLAVSARVRADEEADVCPVCEGRELYVRKDFDPKLGLAVIVTGALISAASTGSGWTSSPTACSGPPRCST